MEDHLNLKRFIALESATKSHQAIMLDIWKNKETIQFPIAIVEDDIFMQEILIFIEQIKRINRYRLCMF